MAMGQNGWVIDSVLRKHCGIVTISAAMVSDRSSVRHDPHNTSFPGNLHQFFVPTQKNARCLPSSFTATPRMYLGKASGLRRKRPVGSGCRLGVVGHAFVSANDSEQISQGHQQKVRA